MLKTYGTCTLNKGIWEIKAEPHVMMRLRRVFARIQEQRGIIRLKDTDEICSELLWFMERYPFVVDPLDHIESRAEKYDQRIEDFDSILSGRIEPRPFEVTLPPREYQKVGADLWLRQRHLLIADELGLGKTCTAICGLTDPATRPALVVTLTHLPHQWEAELKKFAPSLKTHIIRKGKPYDIVNFGKRGVKRRIGRALLQLKDEAHEDYFPDVLIVNYHKLGGWAEILSGLIKSVVYDEIQELRHPGTVKYTAATVISDAAHYNLGLSATPIYNYGGEIHAVYRVLDPTALGSRSEFINEWCVDHGGFSGNKVIIKDPAAFGRYIREQGLMLRRTREEVGRELPEISRIPHTIEANQSALNAVSDRVAELAQLLTSTDKMSGFDKMEAAGELDWRLRQATGIDKAPYVADFLEMLLYQEQKIVVFAWHREVYSILMDRLSKYNPVLYTGTESASQKLKAKEDFCKGDARLIFMSLRSGAGLDGLQFVCNTVVFAELDWSPGVHEQCLGRVARDEQKKPVMGYYLMSEYGSDPVISQALGIKGQQVDGIRNPDAKTVKPSQVDPNRIKSLASAYLKQRGNRN